MSPEGHFLAMQAALLAEGTLSLGMPLVGLSVPFAELPNVNLGPSPVLILGGRLCISLWGQSSTALSTALFAGLFSAVNYQIVTKVRRCLFLVRMEPTGSTITCLPSGDELSESFPSPKCALLTCHEVHVLSCHLQAEQAGAMVFDVFSHPGKDISCEHGEGSAELGGSCCEDTPG